MSRFRPRSLLHLTLVGFTLVTLPLVAVLISAFVSVDRLARQSQLAVFSATDATRSSQILIDEITEMERYARQHEILQDPVVWTLYEDERQEFADVSTRLGQLALGSRQATLLEQMMHAEMELFREIDKAKPGTSQAKQVLDGFAELALLGRQLMAAGVRQIKVESDSARMRAKKAQSLLFWEAVGMIPFALLSAILFTILITRPLHQVGRAIRLLGTGDFTMPVTIKGPRDLEALGERLDWLRRRLAELESQKISVLRHISHEVKTPLAAIREGAELLSDGVLGKLTDDQKEVTDILRQNSVKLQQRIEDLLSFSVKRTPLRDEIRQQIPLRQLVERIIMDHKLAIRSKHLEMNNVLADCSIQGDPEQIHTIFDNLLSNAIKYSPVGGRIRVEMTPIGRELVTDVIDQGPGVNPQEKTRVFEAFYQGEADPHGQVKGTGLGLAIAQEFARLHQGRIQLIDSDQGAHFRLTLPLDPRD